MCDLVKKVFEKTTVGELVQHPLQVVMPRRLIMETAVLGTSALLACAPSPANWANWKTNP